MNDSREIARLLVRELRGFQREILLFPDDATVWATLPGITNSAGNLALHLAGNLRDFVGRVLGGMPYVRDRDDEFGRRAGTREEVVAALEAAIRAVEHTRLDHRLEGEFPERPGGYRLPLPLFLMHLCSHAAYHLGQAGYLRRALTGDARTSGALSLRDIQVPSAQND
jgi:hypothetical protein